ncbi:MAG: phosphoglycerate kinase [Candidatus Altiarchaeales archaeon]|nr:phosphoglycerate kinase [Candidatus Altiarchaeales archaeon]MBD3416954.1 phosphoglycerate kinase [Candidatus Altiarchaeales archaeon]
MLNGYKTLDDVDVSGKKVLLRLDLNSPIDPDTGDFLDDRRFISHRETIQELTDSDAAVVCIAHQGRPGEEDFTTLKEHSRRLGEIVGKDVAYVDDIFGSNAQNAVKNLSGGDVIILENLRFYSEEVLKRPADVQAKTVMVQRMSPLFDLFVNDAFAVAHRSQPSVVGFPMVLPSCIGRLMEKEVRIIGGILENPEHPISFVLGGTKADDSLRVAEKALEHGTDRILTGGVVANIFLAAKDYRIGEPNIEFIRGKKMVDQIEVAKRLLDRYEDRIVLPRDLAVEKSGERSEIDVGDLPTNYKISDIGAKTVELYKKLINESKTSFANGALGIFEDKKFAYGTEEMIKAIAESKSFSVIGGGHTVAAAKNLGVSDKITHVSSGGGACVDFLAGVKLPALEALKSSGL